MQRVRDLGDRFVGRVIVPAAVAEQSRSGGWPVSWKWRKPRVPVEPVLGWRAPHELVDDYAARGVRIAELTGSLAAAENLLALSETRYAESQRTIREQSALIQDLSGRIERQADNHEADRADWERTKSWMAARITELEQTVVAMSAAGLDTAWADVAAVSGPQTKPNGRQ